NLSVLVTDPFMQAVADDAEWPLVFEGRTFRTIRARDLWDRIMRGAYDNAEPGVIFIDRVNAANNLAYCETLHATNPCGEQPLPPYGACLLGSINLARLVRRPFDEAAGIDAAELEDLVAVAVRMLDNAIDVSRYPLEQQRREAHAKRRIGLGVTGLANALAMCRLRYGSDEAADQAPARTAAIERAAYRASIALAREKGAFPLFDRDAYLASGHVRDLDDDIRAEIARHGIRNALLTSIAPTGTISLFADNVSSGIAPVFALTHTRRVLLPDGSHETETVADYAYRLYRARFGDQAELPAYFVTTQELTRREHVVMQAAMQAHVDSSISKTVNCPEDMGFEEFRDLYRLAYDMGLKGCTAYRPNPVTGAVLSAAPAPDAAGAQPSLPLEAPVPDAGGEVVYMKQPLEREPVLPGFTYKLRWPDSDHAIYVTLNDIIQDGR